MKQKKKYYFFGFFLLITAIVAYHYYAASQAEQEIDTAIQEQTAQSNTVSVQYSSINIKPFAGQIAFRDLTVILGDHVERAGHLQVNLSYLDFLNIYFGGVRYGLNNLRKASLKIIKPSYVNQSGLEEIKSDTLEIAYRGNALDGLQSAINGINFEQEQHLDVQSSGLRIRIPKTTINTIVAKDFSYSGSFPAGKPNYWKAGTHQFAWNTLTWIPTESFQKTYSFFIKGFGYPTDAIPFESAHLNSQPGNNPNAIHVETTVRSELALFSSSGIINLEKPLEKSRFQDMEISITEFSETFSRVLTNIEKLFSISLTRENEGITIKLTGTLANPRLAR